MFRSIDAQYLGFQENPFVLDPRQRCDGGMTTGAKTQQESTLRPHAIAGIGIVNDGEQVANRRIFRQRDRKSTRRTPVTNAHLVCRLLLENTKNKKTIYTYTREETQKQQLHIYITKTSLTIQRSTTTI